MRKYSSKFLPYTGMLLLYFSLSTKSFCTASYFKTDSLAQLIQQAQNDRDTEAEAKLLNEIIEIYNIQGNWDDYEKRVHQLLRIAERTKNKAIIAECYTDLGISNAYRGHNQRSLEYFNKALEYNIDEKDTLSIGNSFENIGSVYKDMGNYGEAINYQLKSLNMRRGTDHPRIFNNYISLTLLYGLMENIDKQDVYIARARAELQKGSKDKVERLAIFNNENGKIYHDRGMIDSAITCYENVIMYSEKMGWKRGVAVGKGNLAEIYAEQNRNPEAIEMHWGVLKLSQEIEDCMSIAEEYLYLAVLYNKANKLDSAIWLAECSLERTIECELAKEQIDALLLCADLYEKKGQIKKAFAVYREYHTLYDSILNLDRQNHIAALETQFQIEEKEQQIEHLNLQNEATLIEKARQRQLFILIAIALLCISMAFYYLFKTKQKTQKALEKLDDLKMGFFNNVSHELRTPLTLIAGPVSQLLQSETDQKKHAYLKLIDRNSKKLLGLVNQLLDLSKIDAGFYKLSIEHGDLGELSRRIASEFDSLAQLESINYSYTIEETCLAWYDPRVVEALLLNVLSNAFKYSGQHKKVSLELKLQDKQVNFCIKNSCDIVSDETLAQMFNRFYRSDSSGIGTGIGLALVKELIDIYRAEIRAVYNSENEMQIDIDLPINKNHFTETEFKTSDPVPVAGINAIWESSTSLDTNNIRSNSLPTLLIVEDNVDMQDYIASCFTSQYKLLKANNGQEGVELAIEHMPDLVLSDVMMPVLDGIGLCNALKNNQLTSHIPVILLTAKAGEENTLAGLQSKANDYITKPFSIETLQLKIKNMLDLGLNLREKYSQELLISPLNLIFPSSEASFAKNLQQVLDEHLIRPEFNVEQFCSATNLSRTQLHRKLTSLTGLSATAFIRSQRIKLAAEKIKNEKASIADVCYNVGFNDASYFSKCFKEVMGLTPTEYQMQTAD